MPESAGVRPLSVDEEHSQEAQAELIVDTGNEATDPDEEAVLAELYGEMDRDGVYREVGPRDSE